MGQPREEPSWAMRGRDFREWREQGVYIARPGNTAQIVFVFMNHPLGRGSIKPYSINKATETNEIHAVFPLFDDMATGVYVRQMYSFVVELKDHQVEPFLEETVKEYGEFRYINSEQRRKIEKKLKGERPCEAEETRMSPAAERRSAERPGSSSEEQSRSTFSYGNLKRLGRPRARLRYPVSSSQ